MDCILGFDISALGVNVVQTALTFNAIYFVALRFSLPKPHF